VKVSTLRKCVKALGGELALMMTSLEGGKTTIEKIG
jgi:hypothetical protein